MPKAIRDQTGKGPGDTIEVVVWKDEAVRIVEVPAQFEKVMKKEGLLPVFKKLSYTHRKEYCRWIVEAKKEATRLKRLEKAIGTLKKGVSTPSPKHVDGGVGRPERLPLPAARPRCEVLPIISRTDQDGKRECASIASKEPESELVCGTLGDVGHLVSFAAGGKKEPGSGAVSKMREAA